MTHESQNHIRRIDDKNWYWINRSILKQYGHILGPAGLAVYNVLASYANSKSQTCFPTQKSIAKLLGLSMRTVNRKIRLLKDFRIIKAKKTRGRCFYSLLKVDMPNRIQIYAKRDIGDRTPGKTNNNKLIIVINKNNEENDENHYFKPISHFIEKYDKRNSQNHWH